MISCKSPVLSYVDCARCRPEEQFSTVPVMVPRAAVLLPGLVSWHPNWVSEDRADGVLFLDRWALFISVPKQTLVEWFGIVGCGAEGTSDTHTHSILMAIYPVALLVLLLHLFLDWASFWDRPKLSMSFLTQSHQVFFGRPLCLIPSPSHVIQCLIQSLSSFRSTCPNHLNLLFLIIKLTGSKLPIIQLNPTHPSDHTHFSAIQRRASNM